MGIDLDKRERGKGKKKLISRCQRSKSLTITKTNKRHINQEKQRNIMEKSFYISFHDKKTNCIEIFIYFLTMH